MKKDLIKLNDSIGFDLPKLIESRLLIQANSGGGKSWAIRRIIEQAFGKVQIIVLDPEGEFGNLRSKFDFVYVGRDGDTSTSTRSAAKLAERLLELKASAIVDLYELHPQERKHFVKLFCEAMVNARKELWHDVLVIIDEAHVFAPEKGESEAMGSVIDLATRGRKRGYCVVLATQRLPKLNKDAAAECNNKLIGRASQDIDRKRASEELGFVSREQILSLRDLDPGEFYVFGPAISREVIKVEVGGVAVKPPPRGSARGFQTPPPSAKVKSILSKLEDLPQEAAKEAQTVAELKAALTSSKQEISRLQRQPQPQVGMTDKQFNEVVDKAIKERDKEWSKLLLEWREAAYTLGNFFEKLEKLVAGIPDMEWPDTEPGKPAPKTEFKLPPPPAPETYMDRRPYHPQPFATDGVPGIEPEVKLGLCERKVYSFLRENPVKAFSKVQVGVITGYSPTSGGFNNALSKLRSLSLIRDVGGGLMTAGEERREFLLDGETFSADPSFWGPKLGACERTVYTFLWEKMPNEIVSKDFLGQQTGYSPTSGGFNNALSHLNTLGLIRRVPGGIQLNPEIMDI